MSYLYLMGRQDFMCSVKALLPVSTVDCLRPAFFSKDNRELQTLVALKSGHTLFLCMMDKKSKDTYL